MFPSRPRRPARPSRASAVPTLAVSLTLLDTADPSVYPLGRRYRRRRQRLDQRRCCGCLLVRPRPLGVEQALWRGRRRAHPARDCRCVVPLGRRWRRCCPLSAARLAASRPCTVKCRHNPSSWRSSRKCTFFAVREAGERLAPSEAAPESRLPYDEMASARRCQ